MIARTFLTTAGDFQAFANRPQRDFDPLSFEDFRLQYEGRKSSFGMAH